MRLRARVRHATGATRHFRGRVDPAGEPVRDTELPAPAFVEIVAQDGAFYLLYLDDRGECLTDTWHETLDGAKDQARHEFEISDGDWEPVR